MGSGPRCPEPRLHRAFWRVTNRHGNNSAFNGYHWTPSNYSEVVCLASLGGCGTIWRTNAAYVDRLETAPHNWQLRG